ncbi:alpha/beta fold hydrolase [Steroidobacter sp.]|uniref:alpha/beta fold hydrolase n=1 Tax=Steroidobacter sp. TaxID=1978227 RepID=UPI001A62D727|nr:alpha/beta hydrolase [Steroidobacter sp.]MBL8270504.1 alpha/beta hydrolase [Steroidobacter sp.]
MSAGALATLLVAMLVSSPVFAATKGPGYTRAVAADVEHLQFVQVNGVKLAYRLAGAGVPVFFVHGEGYSHELWTSQLDAFSKHHLVVTYDRRGHGMSDDPITGYSETAHAEDLNALLMHMGIRDAHFVANSRGGAIIIQFLKLYPQKVRSITFADATIPLAPITDGSAFKNAPKAMNGPPPSLEQALAGRESAKKSSFTKVAQARPELHAIQRRMADQFSPRVAMNPQRSDSGSAMHIGPWNSRDFPDMTSMAQPMLVIVGELTDVFFIDGAKEALRLWPNVTHQVMPGTDHLLMLEDPATFNKLVLDFIATTESQLAGRDSWMHPPAPRD